MSVSLNFCVKHFSSWWSSYNKTLQAHSWSDVTTKRKWGEVVRLLAHDGKKYW